MIFICNPDDLTSIIIILNSLFHNFIDFCFNIIINLIIIIIITEEILTKSKIIVGRSGGNIQRGSKERN